MVSFLIPVRFRHPRASDQAPAMPSYESSIDQERNMNGWNLCEQQSLRTNEQTEGEFPGLPLVNSTDASHVPNISLLRAAIKASRIWFEVLLLGTEGSGGLGRGTAESRGENLSIEKNLKSAISFCGAQ